MYNNVLITPTLLNSYEFAINAPPSWKARAMNDFVAKLRREKVDYPAWVQKGIAFEDTVYRVCEKAKVSRMKTITIGSENFQKVANACLGGDFQVVAKKNLEIDKLPVLFYNKFDVSFDDRIKDIKTTLNWKGKQKYLKGWQHKLYLWTVNKFHFDYVVAVWESEHSDTIQEVHTIPYKITSMEDVEDEIIKGVQEMFQFLKDNNLYDDYYYTFSKNRKG